jgi:nitroreductase
MTEDAVSQPTAGRTVSPEGLAAFESLYALQSTQRAMRRMYPDAVSREDLERLIAAAIRAPSGENAQPWAFIVVTDPELRARMGKLYRRVTRPFMWIVSKTTKTDSARRLLKSAAHLSEHMGEAPALIVVCMRWAYPPRWLRVTRAGQWGSIFPAVQNLLLAARALGLGATLTTTHLLRHRKLKRMLGIPRRYQAIAVIPIGFPQGRFASGERKPLEEVLHWDRW